MYCLAKRHGVPTAEAMFPRSRADVLRALESLAFPVMLKGIDGKRLRRRAGQPMFVVDTPADLLARYDALEEPEAPNLMLQELIPGALDSHWMYNGYFDAQSRCLAAFGGRKLRQRPAATGPACLGVCARNPVVEEASRRFMRALGYQGIVDIDYRLDERDGLYKILDVNPRLGGAFRLFVAPDGMDVVRAMYLDLTGQPVDPPAAVDGRKWMVEDADLAAAWQALRQGRLSFGAWRRSLDGVEETAFWAPDDPGPLARVMVNNVKKTFSRLLG
jgi:predicted ATP-grasp superfamily ATP-dependent carboligase